MGDAVAMTALERLLELQDHDTALDQIRHRRRTLPERARLASIASARAALVQGSADVRAQRAELTRTQTRLEDEIAKVDAKAAAVDRQLYDGSITSPKEAQAFQADVESLRRRQATLEDEVLELMEAGEPGDARLAEVAETDATMRAEETGVAAALGAAEADLDQRATELEAERVVLVDGLDPALLATYEGLRPQYGGVAIARLQGVTCQGCHLSLAALEVDRLRHEPPDAIAHCPECGRILVR